MATELPPVFETTVDGWFKTCRQPASEVKFAAGQKVVFTDFDQDKHLTFKYEPPKAGGTLYCQIKGQKTWHVSPKGNEPAAKFLDVFAAEWPECTFEFKS